MQNNDIPIDYRFPEKIHDFILNRSEYEFHRYSNSDLTKIMYEKKYIEEAKKIYTFYDNHPEADVIKPEKYNISKEDVFKYYHDIEFAEIKSLSKQVKFSHIIPNDICKEKFNYKILQYPVFTIFGILYVMWVFLLFSVAGDEIFWVIVGCIFGAPEFILGLFLVYYVIQTILIIIYYLVEIVFKSNKTSAGKLISFIRSRQIDYLIKKN